MSTALARLNGVERELRESHAELARLRSVCRWAAKQQPIDHTRGALNSYGPVGVALFNAADGHWSAVPPEALDGSEGR